MVGKQIYLHGIGQSGASDADSGNNAKIEYSFGYTQTFNLFTIERFTGSIRTKAPLNYEQKTSYDVLIVAVNPGTQFSNTTYNLT
jgi:hypothetical protein